MKTLYVTNLSYLIDDLRLRQIFSPFGEVLSAKIIMDRETGRSRGFGFVEMQSEAADSATKGMNGKEVEGRVLTVTEARPRGQAKNHAQYGGRDRAIP
ncbi:MAG: hypothetical protein RL333_73 [Pseudomonadota bacterium]|jgi:RNA recognition motif-containing protein